MNIAIIHYRSTPPWSVRDLLRAASELGVKAEYLKIQDIDVRLKDNEVEIRYRKRPLEDIDAGIVRGIGLTLSLDLYMKRLGVFEALEQKFFLINSTRSILNTRDKWRSLLRLSINGIPVPETIITENPFTAKDFVEEKGKAVFKPLMGSLGLGSSLITDPDLAYHITRSLLNINIPSYYQEYIEKPGYDLRIFIVGRNVIGAMKRVSNHWKTNIAQGAKGEKATEKEFPEAFKLALKTTEILGLDYAGVDIVIDRDTGRNYVIEANAFPLWRGLKEAVGIDPAKEIIRYVVNKVKR